jgi:hypothetical protein
MEEVRIKGVREEEEVRRIWPEERPVEVQHRQWGYPECKSSRNSKTNDQELE